MKLNKVLLFVMLFLVGVLLISDINFLIRVLDNPKMLTGVASLSYIHFLLFDGYKFEFSLLKLAFTSLVFLLWFVQLFKPCWPQVIANITAVLILFWIAQLLLVVTAIAGVLQQVAGVPIDLSNSINSLSVGAGGYLNLAFYMCIGLSIPCLMLVCSVLYVSRMKIKIVE